ncbi:MAG: hypothetical protein WAK17_29880 [Candidatus Nitrosopolaris sp.]
MRGLIDSTDEKPAHVEQNLKIADIPPMDQTQYKKACQVLLKGE